MIDIFCPSNKFYSKCWFNVTDISIAVVDGCSSITNFIGMIIALLIALLLLILRPLVDGSICIFFLDCRCCNCRKKCWKNVAAEKKRQAILKNDTDIVEQRKKGIIIDAADQESSAADVLTAEIEEEKERKLLVLTKCCSSIAVVINAALNITGAAINTIVMAVRKCSLIIPYIIHILLTDLCHIHPLFSISFTFRIKGGKK